MPVGRAAASWPETVVVCFVVKVDVSAVADCDPET